MLSVLVSCHLLTSFESIRFLVKSIARIMDHNGCGILILLGKVLYKNRLITEYFQPLSLMDLLVCRQIILKSKRKTWQFESVPTVGTIDLRLGNLATIEEYD